MRQSAFITAVVIGAVVFAGSTPVQAADQSAIKRAIVTTVLNNLGVQPTDQLVNGIIGDIPIEFLDSALVREVGTAIDNSEDPTLIISQTVDSDGDGVPNADATVDSTDDAVDGTMDDPVDETVDETDDASAPSTGPDPDPKPKPNPDDNDEKGHGGSGDDDVHDGDD